MLEVQILAVRTRAPYGINNTGPTSGVFGPGYPGTSPEDEPFIDMPAMRHFIRTGDSDGREVAFFSDAIQVPLAPFMGVMAVAPENPTVGQPGVTVAGVQASRPPGAVWRQPRRQGPRGWQHLVLAGLSPGSTVLRRRPPFRAG